MHIGGVVGPDEVWRAWNGAPGITVPLVVTAALYARGVQVVWRRAGRGRGVRRWQVGCFAAGIVAVAAALLSPLDGMAEALFAAHMVQHLLLIQVAAPLLVLGAPQYATFHVLSIPDRQRATAWWHARIALGRGLRAVTTVGAATALHAVALWSWHAPVLYDAALRSDAIHAAEHLSFLGTGVLLWWSVLRPRGRGRAGYPAGVLAVFGTMLHSGALGALLTLARSPWYPAHAGGAAAWGLSPLEDQQLAGLVMWVPGGLLYVAATAVLFGTWLQGRYTRPPTRSAARQPVYALD